MNGAGEVYVVLRVRKLTPTYWPSEVVGPYRWTRAAAERAAEAHAGDAPRAGDWEPLGSMRRLTLADGDYYDVLRVAVED